MVFYIWNFVVASFLIFKINMSQQKYSFNNFAMAQLS